MYGGVMLLRSQLTELPLLIQLLTLIFSGALIYLSVLYLCCILTVKGNSRVAEILDIYYAIAALVRAKLNRNSIAKDRDQID
jgi:hypothetical protein